MSYRRLLTNIASGFALRGVNLVSTLFIVPLALGGLGPARYGILAMVLSATVFFAYADLGLGLGVVNRIAADGGRSDESRAAVTRAWYLLSVIAGVIAVCAAVGGILASLIGTISSEALRTWAIGIASVAVGLPTGLSQRVLFALQRNLEAGLWAASGRIASVFGVFLARKMKLDLDAYIFALLTLPVIVGWINTVFLFRCDRPDLSPSYHLFDFGKLWSDTRYGLQFTVLQVAVYAETGVDNILVGLFKGVPQVAHYDVISRLFAYLPALISVGALPLWPALRDALSRGERAWFDRTIRIAYRLTITLTLVTAVAFIRLHGVIISTWTGKTYLPDYPLAVALGVFSVLTSFSIIQSMRLNALGNIALQSRTQVIGIPILLICKSVAAMNLPLCYLSATGSIICAARLTFIELHSKCSRTSVNG
jgi:O-antigen/teichoic acid export membrane protein